MPPSEWHAFEFQSAMLGLYVLLLAIWFYMCCKHSDQLVSVHYVLSLVLVVSVFSGATRFWSYWISNHFEEGYAPIQLIADLFSCCKIGAGLLTVVMICLG